MAARGFFEDSSELWKINVIMGILGPMFEIRNFHVHFIRGIKRHSFLTFDFLLLIFMMGYICFFQQ